MGSAERLIRDPDVDFGSNFQLQTIPKFRRERLEIIQLLRKERNVIDIGLINKVNDLNEKTEVDEAQKIFYQLARINPDIAIPAFFLMGRHPAVCCAVMIRHKMADDKNLQAKLFGGLLGYYAQNPTRYEHLEGDNYDAMIELASIIALALFEDAERVEKSRRIIDKKLVSGFKNYRKSAEGVNEIFGYCQKTMARRNNIHREIQNRWNEIHDTAPWLFGKEKASGKLKKIAGYFLSDERRRDIERVRDPLGILYTAAVELKKRCLKRLEKKAPKKKSFSFSRLAQKTT
ncbi:MAG: hypothetical protein U9R06_01035 [Patescibacteria group bacterium]|nr:hypothetical protein [Patescibacteria group bacterium]